MNCIVNAARIWLLILLACVCSIGLISTFAILWIYAGWFWCCSAVAVTAFSVWVTGKYGEIY